MAKRGLSHTDRSDRFSVGSDGKTRRHEFGRRFRGPYGISVEYLAPEQTQRPH